MLPFPPRKAIPMSSLAMSNQLNRQTVWCFSHRYHLVRYLFLLTGELPTKSDDRVSACLWNNIGFLLDNHLVSASHIRNSVEYESYIQSKSTCLSYNKQKAREIHVSGFPLSLKFVREATLRIVPASASRGAFHSSSLSGIQKFKSARVKSSLLRLLSFLPRESGREHIRQTL